MSQYLFYNGHISDIEWYLFANPDCRSNCPAQLWLDEGGTGNDFKEAVNQIYEDFLQYAEDVNDIRKKRKKKRVADALEGSSDDAVWAEVKRRLSGESPKKPKSIKQVEIEALLASPDEVMLLTQYF